MRGGPAHRRAVPRALGLAGGARARPALSSSAPLHPTSTPALLLPPHAHVVVVEPRARALSPTHLASPERFGRLRAASPRRRAFTTATTTATTTIGSISALSALSARAHRMTEHTFPDSGDKYLGEWRGVLMHGQGKYTYANGDVYVGAFVDGEMHGHGKMTYVDSMGIRTMTDVYVGKWKNGKKHGQGKMTYRWQITA